MRDPYIDDIEMKSYGDGFVEAAKARRWRKATGGAGSSTATQPPAP